MALNRMTYCNRVEAQRSMDFQDGADANAALDRALRSASENIEAHLHRKFFPMDATRYFDWPNQGGSGGGQYANPWRLWLDQHDLVVLTALSTGGVTITLDKVFLEPVNSGPPFTYLELDRSSNAAFGGNALTPQHSIALTGTFGFDANADNVTTLAGSIGTSDTTLTVTDSSQLAPGDLIIIGYGRAAAPFPSAGGYAGALGALTGERILVTAAAATTTGLTQSGAGCTTASNADQALSTTGTGSLNVGEVLLLDSEQMLVTNVTGGVATVNRAFNGTTLATHSAAAVNAFRLLTVTRAMYGTVAASASGGAAVYKHRPPGLIRDLCIAEAVNRVLQEGSGYARTVGSGDVSMPASGLALADLWDEVTTAYGRKARIRAV